MAKFVDPAELMFTDYEPNTNWRFRMLIGGIPTFVISKTTMPSADSGEIVIPHINMERYVKGKTKWKSITVDIIDSIVPSSAQACMEWLRLAHESLTGRDGYFDMYAKEITIQILGPIGDVVSEWTLKGAWIKALDMSGRDWSSEDYSGITLEIRYNIPVQQY